MPAFDKSALDQAVTDVEQAYAAASAAKDGATQAQVNVATVQGQLTAAQQAASAATAGIQQADQAAQQKLQALRDLVNSFDTAATPTTPTPPAAGATVPTAQPGAGTVAQAAALPQA